MFVKVKRISALVLVLVLLMGCMTACSNQGKTDGQKTNEQLESELQDLQGQLESMKAIEANPPPAETVMITPTPTPVPDYELLVWSFSQDMLPMAIAFKEANPNIAVKFVVVPMEDYQTSLIDAAKTNKCPDIIALDAAWVKDIVDGDMLLDLSDLKPYADEAKTYQYTIQMGTNSTTGEIKAFSYQNSVGAVFYRRSLAKEYFGTDDPSEIQALMSDMDKFTAMAQTVKEKSGGKTAMVSSYQDFGNGILAKREQPWFVDNTLVIDPIAEEYIDIAKNYRDNGYDAGAGQWTGEWYAGMNDTLTNANGEPLNIFCYFLPTWGLQYVLVPNCTETAGDWACCAGPLPYQWGGTWLGVMKNTARPDISKEFIRFCTMDADNLTNWATGVYTNEYLTAISPELVNAGSTPVLMPAGDFISSQIVADAITSQFDSSSLSSFLGGQNPYAVFSAAAQNCRADAVRKYDDEAQMYLTRSIESYLSGLLTKKGALKTFKEDMLYVLQDINT